MIQFYYRGMQNMLDQKIYTLLKVAETGNFTKAGKELNLTQPAISQHIRLLEKQLGVKLFQRVGTRIMVTREGENVVDTAKTMLSLYQNLQQELKNEASGLTSMTIGITHTVESNRISEVFAKYASMKRGVSIKLITSTKEKLRSGIKNMELDFAIIDGRINDEILQSMQLDMDSLLLVSAPGHHLSRQSVVTINDLKPEPMILRLPNSGTADLLNAALESRNISLDEFNVILEMDNIATIKDLVRRGYGVSILPKSACQSEIRSRKLAAIPIENLSMIREINIYYLKGFKYLDTLSELVRIYSEM